MGKLLDQARRTARAMLPQFEPEPMPAPVPAPAVPVPEPAPVVVTNYGATATPADLIAAGICGGMSAEEIESRLARVMGASPCEPPSL